MAADQRITGSGPLAHINKIYRIKGSLFGFCGDTFLAMHLLTWLKGNRDPLELYKLIPDAHRDDVGALELAKDGLAIWSGWGARLPLLDISYAMGTGSMVALQALRTGSSPAEAIAHAARMDECSGAFVEPQVEVLEKKKRG
jgi:hypothetical protein